MMLKHFPTWGWATPETAHGSVISSATSQSRGGFLGETKMTLEQQLEQAYAIRDFRDREIEVARIEREISKLKQSTNLEKTK